MILDSHRYSRYFTYIKPVARSPIVKTYAAPIFTLMAMAIFIIFAIKPTVETILVLEKKIEEYKSAYEQITKKTEDLTQARTNYRNIDTEVKTKIQESLPSNPELRSLIQLLEQTAKVNEASISALQIQPLTIEAASMNNSGGEITEIGFTFNLESSYENLLKILAELHKNVRITSIDSLTVNKLESNTLFLSINGKAYYLK